MESEIGAENVIATLKNVSYEVDDFLNIVSINLFYEIILFSFYYKNLANAPSSFFHDEFILNQSYIGSKFLLRLEKGP